MLLCTIERRKWEPKRITSMRAAGECSNRNSYSSTEAGAFVVLIAGMYSTRIVRRLTRSSER